MLAKQHILIIVFCATVAAAAAFFSAGLPRLSRSIDPLDGGKNWNMAQNLVHHGVLSSDVEPPFRPSARRVPIYSIFLAIFIQLGWRPAWILALQFLLGVASPLLVYALGRELFSPRIGFLAALLMSVHPMQLAMPSTFDDAWLFEIPWLAALLFFFKALREERWEQPYLLSAALLGIAGLVRPLTFIVWPVFVVTLMWTRWNRIAFTKLFRASALFVLILSVIWAPWLYRNWYHYRRIVVTIQDSYTLVWDTLAYHISGRDHIPFKQAQEKIRYDIEKIVGHKLPVQDESPTDPYTQPELAATIRSYALGIIAREPLTFSISLVRHSLPYWTGSSLREFMVSARIFPERLQKNLPQFTRALTAGNISILFEGFSRLGPWLILYVLDALIFWLFLYGLTGYTVVRLVFGTDRPLRFVAVFFVIMAIVSPLITSGVYIGPRYRFPLEPLLILFAVAGMASAIHTLSRPVTKME